MADTTLIPFGKYRNQPLAAMAQDHQYREWLLGQDWFAQRYPDIHTIIINNFGEPGETPEHNALQLRFLDEDLRQRCSVALMAFRQHPCILASVGKPVFEHEGHDVLWSQAGWFCQGAFESGRYEYPYTKTIHPACWGEYFNGTAGSWPYARVECKPSLGDDYPQVLRYMRNLKVPGNVLCVGDYAFRGGSVADVKRFFAHSGILLTSLDALLGSSMPNMIQSQAQLPDPESFLATLSASRKATP